MSDVLDIIDKERLGENAEQNVENSGNTSVGNSGKLNVENKEGTEFENANMEKPREETLVKQNTQNSQTMTKNEGEGYNSVLEGQNLDLPGDNAIPSKENDLIDENDLDEYDPDLFITDEEKLAFEYMLTQKREDLVQRKEKFDKWLDSITRRRMFALSRIRKIKQNYTRRKQFFGEVENYVREVHSALNSAKPSTASSHVQTPASETAKGQTNQTLGANENSSVEHSVSKSIQSRTNNDKNVEREGTGFVVKEQGFEASLVKDKLPIIVQVKS